MIDIVEESERLHRWVEMLRGDVLAILREREMSPETKIEALSALVMTSPPPVCIKCVVERDHFRRSQRRNARSAERMRAKRTGTLLALKETSHGQ
jgi:hypothetical protein